MTPSPARRWTPLLGVLAVLIALTAAGIAVDRSGLLEPRGAGPKAGPTGTGTATTAVESLAEQLQRVARIVEEVRDLRFEQVPEPTFLPPDELAERAAGFLEQYTDEDAEEDRLLLEALGAVPPGTDLRALLSTALEEQVAGFYDPETGEMVVGTAAQGERLGPLDEITLAHELEHALADQVLGLPDLSGVPSGDEDAAFAVQALIEGDATLTMVRYAETAMSVVDQARLLADQSRLAAELGALSDMPHYLRRSLLFPYEEGLSFVSAVEARGGWELVDAAYTRRPTTTLQILRPQLYLDGEGAARDPRDPGDPGAGWERLDEVAVGAADLLFLFEAPGGDTARALDDPRGSAGAWLGGEAVLWSDGDASAVGVALLGAPALCDAVTDWYRAAFPSAAVAQRGEAVTLDGPEQDARITCSGEEVRLGIAPDGRTAAALVR